MRPQRRGDVTTPVILWIGVIIAVIIIISWFTLRIFPIQQDSENARADLLMIKDAITTACQSKTYTKQYNPLTSKGILEVNATTICLKTLTRSECKEIACTLNTEKTFEMSTVLYLAIIKDDRGIIIEQR